MFKTALNNYNRLSEELKTVKATREAIDKTTRELIRDGNIKAYEAHKEATEADFLKACEDEKILSLAIRFAKENLRIAYYADIMPELLKMLAKYKGKRIGEKTADKINAEAQDRFNCAVYISSGGAYGADKISLVPLNDEGFSSYIFNYSYLEVRPKKYDNRILIDNTLQPITMDELYLVDCLENITENPKETAKEILKEFNELAEEHKKHFNKVSCFNERLPKGVDRVKAESWSLYLNF